MPRKLKRKDLFKHCPKTTEVVIKVCKFGKFYSHCDDLYSRVKDVLMYIQ